MTFLGEAHYGIVQAKFHIVTQIWAAKLEKKFPEQWRKVHADR